jgi:hypothetical protein
VFSGDVLLIAGQIFRAVGAEEVIDFSHDQAFP